MKVSGALPVTVDSICASPAATTPALKSTLGVKPRVSWRQGKNHGKTYENHGKYRNMMEIDGTYQKFMKLEKFKG